jgi:DNA-binding MurR/RpiR family transcriptional regulator
MLIEKLERAVDFTNQENIISDYILHHPDEFQKMNCEELGKVTFTSKSTVVRLCKKLGVSGYQELKKILYFEFGEISKSSPAKKCLQINEASSYEDIMMILPDIYIESINEVRLHNNPNVFKRIINRMCKMDHIDLYGTGISYTLLEVVSQKFNVIGIESKAYNTLNERYLFANRKKSKIMAFVMTFSGNNPLAIHEAEFLKSIGIYVVGIVGIYADEILKSCDEVLKIPYRLFEQEAFEMFSYQSIMYMMDIFVASMLAKNFDEIQAQERSVDFDYDKNFYCDTKVSKKNKIDKS